MTMPAVVAVTGASGSLGRVVVERLIARPEVEKIISLDLNPPSRPLRKVEHHAADVCDPGIAAHFSGVQAVLHLAFIVERGSRDTALVDRVNIGGTQNVFKSAAAAGVKQIVYASSIAAYGFFRENIGVVLDESSPIRGNPDFYYSRTKAEVELWIRAFRAENPGITIAVMRPTVFLGANSHSERQRLLKLRFLPYIAGAPVLTHFTHEDDVADAFVLALEKQASGEFNVATSEPLPMSAWPKCAGKVGLPLPAAAVKLAQFAYARGWSDMDPAWIKTPSEIPIVVSAEKIQRGLGWRPKHPTTALALKALASR